MIIYEFHYRFEIRPAKSLWKADFKNFIQTYKFLLFEIAEYLRNYVLQIFASFEHSKTAELSPKLDILWLRILLRDLQCFKRPLSAIVKFDTQEKIVFLGNLYHFQLQTFLNRNVMIL